jgi:hypothetical protein
MVRRFSRIEPSAATRRCAAGACRSLASGLASMNPMHQRHNADPAGPATLTRAELAAVGSSPRRTFRAEKSFSAL